MAPHSIKQGHPTQLEDRPSTPCRGVRDGIPPAVPREGVSTRPTFSTQRRTDAVWNLLLVLAMFLLAMAGCKDPNTMEKTRQRAEAAGKRDGKSAGDSDGFNSAYEPAKDHAYNAKIDELYTSNNFTRQWSYTLLVLVVAFLLGFSLQYTVLYLLRRKELLFDIDRIVLPKHETQVNLTRLLDTQGLEDVPAPKQLKAADANSTHGQ